MRPKGSLFAATRQFLASLLVLVGSYLIIARTASAQQLNVNSMWVADSSVNCVGPVSVAGALGQFLCSGPPQECSPNGAGCAVTASSGNISNNPQIQFDQTVPGSCAGLTNFPSGSIFRNICQKQLYLCANIFAQNTQSGATAFGIDSLEFEIFQYAGTGGSNPLDPASTPPLRTFFVDNPGTVPASFSGTIPLNATCNAAGLANAPCGSCVLWDGSYNILGAFGRTNGQFGFRATVATNQTNSTSGNINITQTRAYPNGATVDSNGVAVSQAPITVDVTDVHVVRTTSTVIGSITGVAAEPYNITYRLSKDATMYLTIANANTPATVVRNLVPGLPRIGEGTPGGSVTNGDAWNGREDNGAMAPPGTYLATLQATGSDQYGNDLSFPTTATISLDPVQITDIQVSPLTGQSTSLAVLTYTLTEPATTYIDIYPPGTQFCAGLNNVNNPSFDQPLPSFPPKNFQPTLGACGGPIIAPIKRFVQQQNFRSPVISFWDGRDLNGNMQPDGDYVFVMYAAMVSQNGFAFNGVASDPRIWTSVAKSGFVPISRGLVGISQIVPITTVIGSSQPVSGLNPVFFNYSLSRDAIVSIKIFDSSGKNLKRTLINQQVRSGNFLNQEVWPDGMDDNGNVLSSGTYFVQLTAADQFLPSQVSTASAIFPLNLFRITDANITPLLTGATDLVTLTYQLSQGMNIAWNIYSPGTSIVSNGIWPPCGAINPGVCAQTLNSAGQPSSPFITVTGMRPGRLKITETWDGRNPNGIFVPDGTYIFTLTAQSTTTPSYFAADRVFGSITIARGSVAFLVFNVKPTVPALFNSSQTITLPPFQVDYTLTRQSSVTIQILNTNPSPQIVRTVISGQIRDANILNSDFWDGRSDQGSFVPQGFYTVQVLASDLASVLSSGSTAQQTIAVDPLRVYDVAVRSLLGDPANAGISYQVSETMKTSVKIYKPGTLFDPNGNPTPPEAVSLVKRIVGVRPERTQINETWDGTNLQLAQVQDGSYLFRIIASTDSNAIDSLTGNPVPGASLAEDLIVDNIPVVRGALADPQGSLERNSFMYPNPLQGSQATFNIYSPFQANVDVKLFNLAGELVYERYFPNQPPSVTNGPIVFPWSRVNSTGKTVAAGVYFVLIREEETLGGSNVLQTVKKIVLK